MSIPKNRTVKADYDKTVTQYTGNVVPTHYGPYDSHKVISSSGNFTRTPFVYRGPTRLIAGELFVDGERTGGDAVQKMRYKDYQLLVKRNMWRNPTPYNASIVEGDINHFSGNHGYQSKGQFWIRTELTGKLPCVDYGLDVPSIPVFPGDLEQRAVVKALLKLKDQKVNLGVAFGERKETVRLVSDTLAGLTHAAHSLRKGNLRGVMEGLKLRGKAKALKGRNFHERWLELQYGWKPLLNDVYGAVAALHERDREDPKRYMQTVTATVSQTSNRVEKQSRYNCVGTTRNITLFQGCFVRLDYFIANPLTGSLAALGITNPASVAWELIPWSFVADWFIPIGDYLSCMDAAVGFDFRCGTVSQLSRQKFLAYIYGEDNQYSTSYFPTGINGSANVRSMSLTRRVLQSSPLPRVPSFRNPFPRNNASHLKNAIALLASSGDGRRVART